jgi:signal peptidase I
MQHGCLPGEGGRLFLVLRMVPSRETAISMVEPGDSARRELPPETEEEFTPGVVEGGLEEAPSFQLEGELPAVVPSAGAKNPLLEAFVLVLLALVLALSLKTYVAEAYEIKGRSMMPTFHNGERVVVLKAFYQIERGDIIIFSPRHDPTKDLIKRVIGLPGDRIRIEDNRVYINDSPEPLVEDYIRSDLYPAGRGVHVETVGPSEYYVLGDNRGDSQDSRGFHGVPAENIKGKVILRWWPVHEIRSF